MVCHAKLANPLLPARARIQGFLVPQSPGVLGPSRIGGDYNQSPTMSCAIHVSSHPRVPIPCFHHPLHPCPPRGIYCMRHGIVCAIIADARVPRSSRPSAPSATPSTLAARTSRAPTSTASSAATPAPSRASRTHTGHNIVGTTIVMAGIRRELLVRIQAITF